MLVVAALVAFAVFNNGAYFLSAMTLCIVGSWAVVIGLLFANKHETLSGWSPGQLGLLGIAVCLWMWMGLSLVWSISADQTWIDFNRMGGYAAVLLIGMVVGRKRYPPRLAVMLLLAVVTSAALYGLASKALPSLVDNMDEMGRLAVPIGYINAMGLLMAIGFPLSVYLVSARDFHWLVRLLSAMAAPLILVSLFFTFSRGSILALLFGLLLYFIIAPIRLRSFGALVLPMLPAALIANWSNGQDALLKDHVAMSERLTAASSLRWYLLFTVLAVGIVFLIFLVAGKHVRVPAAAGKVTGAAIILVLFAAVVGGSAILVTSKPSFGDWSVQAYRDFRYGVPSSEGTARLLQLGSSGRWVLWQEALANWEAHPVAGTGAQTFPLVHLARRGSEAIFVKQAHGLGFSLLTELGMVGFALGGAFIAAAMTLGMLAWRRTRDRWERGLAASIVSVMVIYLIHTSFDWDWNMFGLTMIFFFFAGIMAGWPRLSKA
ncbi:MAG: O-antigen ligase family protein [Actinobacteria bacterium]|nr:O-antigen ligase family protein [Actinomycetota bacterium]